jgi:DNA-binding LacI/PurR family transcriptional regulator
LYPFIARSDSRVTSVDVARRAGVSQSTVSLVLSGKSAGRISARTEAAVRQAAEELGYRLNVAARALRTGTARTVAMVVTDVTHPFFGPVLRGAQAAAWRAGYAVTLVDVANDPDREQASFEALRAGPADGFMFFTVDPPEHSGEHVVAIEVSPPGMPFARFDTERGTDIAIDHLLSLGHRRIGHLASELDAETFQIRREHVLARLAAAGLEPRGYETAAFKFDDAHAAALRLLDTPDPPTAVYCDDDLLAGGIYLAARDLGLRIPGDLSVVGFDDLPFAQVFDPPLTTIRIDPEALGATAFELLAALMDDREVEGQILPVELVVRGSTAQPGPTAAG